MGGGPNSSPESKASDVDLRLGRGTQAVIIAAVTGAHACTRPSRIIRATGLAHRGIPPTFTEQSSKSQSWGKTPDSFPAASYVTPTESAAIAYLLRPSVSQTKWGACQVDSGRSASDRGSCGRG